MDQIIGHWEVKMSELSEINIQRELLNYESSHLYNQAKHGSTVGSLDPRQRPIDSQENNAEYGLVTFEGGKKRTWKFPSLERCEQERESRPGSYVVRLGRNFEAKRNWTEKIKKDKNRSTISFLASADESGNIETPENEVVLDRNVFQLISSELIVMGYYSGSRPPAEVLRSLAMRYNDIVPEEFAAAVVKHCEIPRISDGEDKNQGKSPFKSPEEKEAWYDTPAGKAWVKEHPIPSIFNLPTPEYIHRRG